MCAFRCFLSSLLCFMSAVGVPSDVIELVFGPTLYGRQSDVNEYFDVSSSPDSKS